MTAVTLLTDLTRRGFRVSPRGHNLIVEPASQLTVADRAAIKTLKRALMALLLDTQRNEHDRQIGRGYDYAPQHITDDYFGLCEVCGDPASMIVPNETAINGKRRCCGTFCYEHEQQPETPEEKK